MNKQTALTPEQLQQHPEIALLTTLLAALILTLLVAGVAVWMFAWKKWRLGEPLLKIEPWTPRAWGLVDILFVALMVIVSQVASIQVWTALSGSSVEELKENSVPLSAMATVSASYLVVLLLAIGWIAGRHRVGLSHLGFSFNEFGKRIGLGFVAAAAFLPIVYVTMILVSIGLDEEYQHPLIDGISEGGTFVALLLGAFSAAIVAPITEEFAFRVLLQGWLQSFPDNLRDARWLLGGVPTSAPSLASIPPTDELLSSNLTNPYAVGQFQPTYSPIPQATSAPSLDVVQPSGASITFTETNLPREAFGSPYSSPDNASDKSSEPQLLADPTPVPPIWPIFVSGTLFGVAHVGYGMSFIPLALLGYGLGWLYRAKQSIWPCLIVHMTLNGIAMLGLALKILTDSVTK